MRRDVQTVNHLLQQGWNPDIRDALGTPALHLAVEVRSREIVQLLLDAGANPNLTDELSEPALLWAVTFKRFELVNLLLSYGADPDQESIDPEHGTSPRKLAKERGYSFFEKDD